LSSNEDIDFSKWEKERTAKAKAFKVRVWRNIKAEAGQQKESSKRLVKAQCLRE